MVAVFLSGIIGRFIYIRIPRNIEGHELSLNEINGFRTNVAEIARNNYNLDEESYNILTNSIKKKVDLYHKNPVVRYIEKHPRRHRVC
ncbi:MAG: hypothetical protein MZV64_16030 [Ignavibacteriales bacterium]|nr:hypothetical protein [Ignavibacteriales bacterium]